MICSIVLVSSKLVLEAKVVLLKWVRSASRTVSLLERERRIGRSLEEFDVKCDRKNHLEAWRTFSEG